MNLFTMVSKELRRNKATAVILLFFVMLSSFLMSSSFLLIVKTTTSIRSLYEVANPPHFIQMHKGEVDERKIAELAKETDYVTDYQIMEMIDIDGEDISYYSVNNYSPNSDVTDNTIDRVELKDSVVDNGFIVNHEKYDRLLDLDNEYVTLNKGEIGVPIIYTESYDIKLGDILCISNGDVSKEFMVKTFIRDAQMNSTMCSSTRFLLNEEDYSELKTVIGETEYEIEYYFTDVSYASKFQTVYENAGLPMNGQAITYGLMKLLSCFSDIMLAIVIGLVSILVVLISIQCLRFTIKAAMEGELKQIGTMRAIGIRKKDITALYVAKYRVITIAGCILGYVSSILFGNIFASHSNRAFGHSEYGTIDLLLPVAGAVIVYVLILSSCRRILKKSSRVTVVEALVTGKPSKKIRAWSMMFGTAFLLTVIVIIPMNLYSTVSARSFASYMGTASSDISLRLQTADDLNGKQSSIEKILEENEEVKSARVYAECRYEIKNEDGEITNFRVSCGDYSNVDLKFLSGRMPQQGNEIALSLLNAKLYEKSVGDTLILEIGGKENLLQISGIYQDVTDGGYTAKMNRNYNPEDAAAYTTSVFLKNNANISGNMEKLKSGCPEGTKIMETREYIKKTMKSLTSAFYMAYVVIWMIVIFLMGLITVLFMKLNMVQNYSHIATLKAIGFSTRDIVRQYLFKMSKVTVPGILIGVLFANTVGELLVSSLMSMSGRGISQIIFQIDPIRTLLVCPVTIFAVILIATWLCAKAVKQYNIINLINE